MALADLRQGRAMSQMAVADALGVNQAWVSRLERRTDMNVATLRRYVEAIGGTLELTVRFGSKAYAVEGLDSAPAEEDDSAA